jgi:hypothetical protein
MWHMPETASNAPQVKSLPIRSGSSFFNGSGFSHLRDELLERGTKRLMIDLHLITTEASSGDPAGWVRVARVLLH